MANLSVKEPITKTANDSSKSYVNCDDRGRKNSTFCFSKHDVLRKSRGCQSFDWNVTQVLDSRTTPAKAELYSYGRRDSVNRTRFLLVRTSSNQGKESFKRITLPGGGTVDFLKFTVEKAMRRGKVAKVLLLPSQIPIERNEQLFELQDSQKVEVVFETNHKHQERCSPKEKTITDRLESGKSAKSNNSAGNTKELNAVSPNLATKPLVQEEEAKIVAIPAAFLLPPSIEFAKSTLPISTDILQVSKRLISTTSKLNSNTQACKPEQKKKRLTTAVFGFINKLCALPEQAALAEETHKKNVAQVVLIIVGIGGAVGIGYYIYSRK